MDRRSTKFSVREDMQVQAVHSKKKTLPFSQVLHSFSEIQVGVEFMEGNTDWKEKS